ncbi:hypothetical protein MXD63_29520 [Frankia sp. Cpl3]|nr:hypothetical protein [Frankia sp. Cpl3]
MIVIVGGLGAVAYVGASDAKTSPSGETPPAATACPDPVAAALPGGAGTLVAAFTTPLHAVTICQDNAGSLHYYGASITDPGTNLHRRAELTDFGYQAVNGEYRYEIRVHDGELVICRGAGVIGREQLQPVAS